MNASPLTAYNCCGLVVGGLQSSDGKTVITCMLLATLRMRTVPIQPFKVGPDFIDPGYHSRVSGVASRNLDAWLMLIRAQNPRASETVNDTDVSARCGSASFFDASAKGEGSAIRKRSRDTGTLVAGTESSRDGKQRLTD